MLRLQLSCLWVRGRLCSPRGARLLVQTGSPAACVPAFRVEAVEPTGAGDAFTAGIIARSLASDWAPLTFQDVQYAAAAGAWRQRDRGRGMGYRTERNLKRSLLVNRGSRFGRSHCSSADRLFGPGDAVAIDPIAFSVFGLDVRWYALFMLAGVVAGLFLARFLAGRIGLDPD